METTPRPWHAEHFSGSAPCGDDDIWDVTYGPADDASERFSVLSALTEADARLIVHAVNNHEKLIAALKPFADIQEQDCNETVWKAVLAARAVIAEAVR